MGMQDVRNAFLAGGEGKLRITDCFLHTLPDGNNSQRLQINGFDATGAPFSLDSGAFDPKTNPMHKAADMARGWLKQQAAGFPQAPAAAHR